MTDMDRARAYAYANVGDIICPGDGRSIRDALAEHLAAFAAERPGVGDLDRRCGFHESGIEHSPEWLAACEKLAERFEHWKMPETAKRIRCGTPSWLTEQICIETIMQLLAPPPSASVDGEVTQADRDAAADFYGPHLARPGEVLVTAHMRAGKIDESPLIQAFARHRLSAPPIPATCGGEGELADRARAAVERLANAPMGISLAEWGNAITPILAALEALSPTPVAGGGE